MPNGKQSPLSTSSMHSNDQDAHYTVPVSPRPPRNLPTQPTTFCPFVPLLHLPKATTPSTPFSPNSTSSGSSSPLLGIVEDPIVKIIRLCCHGGQKRPHELSYTCNMAAWFVPGSVPLVCFNKMSPEHNPFQDVMLSSTKLEQAGEHPIRVYRDAECTYRARCSITVATSPVVQRFNISPSLSLISARFR
jgi:hypothetical protein